MKLIGTMLGAAALLTAALPGSLYIYQGDELGLPESEEIPLELLSDPMHERSAGVDPGRDGCRVPLPWAGEAPPFAFSPLGAGSEPWLPQPVSWASLAAETQERDPASMLSLYRHALLIRRSLDLGHQPFRWCAAPTGVLSFARGDGFRSVTNLSSEPVALPQHSEILLSSAPLDGGRSAPDTTVWLRP